MYLITARICFVSAHEQATRARTSSSKDGGAPCMRADRARKAHGLSARGRIDGGALWGEMARVPVYGIGVPKPQPRVH